LLTSSFHYFLSRETFFCHPKKLIKTMADKKPNKKFPPCFGELETVFPKNANGLRNTPETCLACGHKTECLRSAIEGTGGLKVREEIIDRAYQSGRINFLERWSKKKALKRKLKEKNRIDEKGRKNHEND
jgi:hypothetical protein